MNTEKKPVDSSSRFSERMVGVAGGAILSASLGMMIFNSMDGHFSSDWSAAIAGVGGGLVAILQRINSKRKPQGEKID